MLLQAALNGARAPRSHPAIPADAATLADDAARCVRAGAAALHFHVRDAAGAESLRREDVGTTLAAVREACPGVPCGVSTGGWIVPDPVERLHAVTMWEALPDYASVNFDEPGAAAVAAALHRRGVGIEVGLDSRAAAELLVESGFAAHCLRVLIEPGDEWLAEALATAAAIESTLDDAGVACPRLLHGVERTTWPLLQVAWRRGYATRIGLEDTLFLPGGDRAPDNAALVRAAVALTRAPPAAAT